MAAGALFAERGVRGTTVREIGDRVGVLSGSLYHHFKTKNDIVHELMRPYCAELLEKYRRAVLPGGTTRDKLRRLFLACMDANLEHPDEETILILELPNLFRDDEFVYIHDTLAKIEELFVDVLQEGVRRGEIRHDVEPHFTYRMMMDVMGAVPRWFVPGQHDRNLVVDAWIDVFLTGISPHAT